MQNLRIRRKHATLMLIDIQERLLPAMAKPDSVLQNAMRLVRGMAVLEVPVLVTEQYRKGLGATTPELAAAIPGFAPLEKLHFSACGCSGIVEQLISVSNRDVILCGIEAHVCVLQTCLDLLEQRHRVFVVSDAVSSRTEENRLLAIRRMEQAGASIVSTEMVLFELVEKAGTAEFKAILELVK